MSSTTTVGEWVKTRRTDRGLTQNELGAAAGVSQSRVAKWEADELAVRLEQAAKLFEALGVRDDEVADLLRLFAAE